MNIIIKEHQYLKILTESLGVSRASLHYVNVIYKILEPTVLKFLNSNRDLNEKINIEIDLEKHNELFVSYLGHISKKISLKKMIQNLQMKYI